MSLALTVGMTSCMNELDISPIDPQVDTQFHQDEIFAKIYATMALTGQEGPAGYGDVAGIDEGTSAFYRLIFTVNEYPTDEALCSWNDAGIPELNFINWGSSHGQLEGLYGRLTFDVTLCNHFLEETADLTDDKTVRQRAEARFMRALNYYYLMDIYGNPPFAENISFDEKPEQIKRADLFAYIESELKAIESDMYEPGQAAFGRADKVANWLLLSRMYLNAEVYTGAARWADAAAMAKKVMDNTVYGLCSNYTHLFMADNDENKDAMKEIILPIRQDGVKTISYGGSLYAIAATHTNGMTSWGTSEGWGGVRARKALVDKFFPNGNVPINVNEKAMVAAAKDDRALFFSGVNDEDTRTVEIKKVATFKEGLSVAKWTNVRSDGKASHDTRWTDTDIPFFRVAEAYLTYAEALLRSGGSVTDALKAVNALRDRAHASKLETLTLDGILNEKAREFYFEGQRRIDLVRYGYFTSNKYIWDWKGGVDAGTSVNSFYNICPIPSSDLIVNPNLKQNPGY